MVSLGRPAIWGSSPGQSDTTTPTQLPLPNPVGGASQAIQVSLSTGNGLAVAITSGTVHGRTQSQAVAQLQAAGLVGSVTFAPIIDCPDRNKAIDQDPAPGTEVALGSTVNLTIGQLPAGMSCG